MTAERCPSRLKEHDWKSCRRATVSRVRIPPSPPSTSCCLTQRVLAILPLTVLLPLALLLLVLPIFLAACGGSGSQTLQVRKGRRPPPQWRPSPLHQPPPRFRT